MDVFEFFNVLFEQLDSNLQTSGRPHFLKEYFGGKIVNEVISKDCAHIYKTEEFFYNISIWSRGNRDINTALQDFMAEQILSGVNAFSCSKCGKKVEALRRSVIKELPQNLILHLKRFGKRETCTARG